MHPVSEVGDVGQLTIFTRKCGFLEASVSSTPRLTHLLGQVNWSLCVSLKFHFLSLLRVNKVGLVLKIITYLLILFERIIFYIVISKFCCNIYIKYRR